MNLTITSEVGQLQAVIVHTPGHEVSLVNPEIKDELLFDDIIFEEDARGEHQDMLQMFKSGMPASGSIFEITDLMIEAFSDENARGYIVEQLIKSLPEENLAMVEKEILKLNPAGLSAFLITGAAGLEGSFCLPPSPNLLFTRDLAAVVGSTIIVSRAAKKVRMRESLIMETLVKYHPLFAPVKENAIYMQGHQSIEGGDVLVESDKLVLIGMSERTSFSGLMRTADGLLSSGVETVLAIDIPKKRSSMHLDTIFTFISENECIVFPPAIIEQKNNVVAIQKRNADLNVRQISSLKEALLEFSGKEYTFINCGGNNRTNQFREQWTDGANLFALSEGVVVGYERNTNTFSALAEHGYELMNQFEFIEQFDTSEHIASGRKIAVSFQGHELCRGRGGSRCMTLPISRSTLKN